MSIQSFVDYMEGRFASNTAARSILEKSEGEFADLPGELDSRLVEALRKTGLSQLYSHQAEAFHSIRQGNDTVLVSRTASGKTLSFLLPILHEYLQADAPFV